MDSFSGFIRNLCEKRLYLDRHQRTVAEAQEHVSDSNRKSFSQVTLFLFDQTLVLCRKDVFSKNAYVFKVRHQFVIDR